MKRIIIQILFLILIVTRGNSQNNPVSDAFPQGTIVDFYGPAELIMFPRAGDEKSPESILIGAAPLDRPDLAKAASPVTYVDKDDPPFLIIHGEKDDLVSPNQSRLLSSWLNVSGVQNELLIVKDAPHFGVMFDSVEVRNKVLSFLRKYLN